VYPEASRDLIDRARSDRHAFGEMYDHYVHRVYAFCLSRTNDRDEAEEVTSQTFERALSAIGRYEHRGSGFSSWLLRISANLLVDRSRGRSRLVLMGDEPMPELPRDQPREPRPEEWVEQWERAAWLRAHMATLPREQQIALRLRYWDGLSMAEVGKRLGKSENATKQTIHRAMLSLRARIAREATVDA
jgi:RNA polymerase sigma-70 factor (ECF subfamily)